MNIKTTRTLNNGLEMPVFGLSRDQTARLDALEEGLHVAWDPTGAP